MQGKSLGVQALLPLAGIANGQELHDGRGGRILVELRIRVHPGQEFGQHLVTRCARPGLGNADHRFLLRAAKQRSLIDALAESEAEGLAELVCLVFAESNHCLRSDIGLRDAG